MNLGVFVSTLVPQCISSGQNDDCIPDEQSDRSATAQTFSSIASLSNGDNLACHDQTINRPEKNRTKPWNRRLVLLTVAESKVPDSFYRIKKSEIGAEIVHCNYGIAAQLYSDCLSVQCFIENHLALL